MYCIFTDSYCIGFYKFSMNCPTGLIQSLSCNDPESSVCVFAPSRKTSFTVDWRLLVEERIANIGIPLDISGFYRFDDVLDLDFFSLSHNT